MAIGERLQDLRAEGADFRAQGLGALDEDQRQRDEGALPDKVDRVPRHGLEEVDGFVEARAGARDPQGEGGAVAD
ncbi:hypothetical protein LTR53_018468, partial [Teratosphaeriaceae sp. CCFEE 6253]